MNEADRQIADLYEFRVMLEKLIVYYENGEVIRPLGEDPVEATAKWIDRLKVEKAYADNLIPKLEAMRG